ncbi:lysine N(6)-hydroxylase/L-ornithine N(5)-oxygenase family protein [Streptomyces sp. NBC_00582]|uniref:lysine N(6)-hydroxylase/L-ornithine N(5)-oxygenase family protein n=1 Tax=Streptomyces sp. NBC_00582 TaxID=2975783 RepID=UPI0010633FD4|nr:lysine N(6)-hydroxylase/L-ornithine N(5)-oxygenase family protein [Streptomyces sp. NBC_00582]WUB63920.1 lysine N(6)-hydroxylase/L-ornithine N(5)-oxygenase family protein [Streptomyces sp. NBC_00582]
MTAAALPNTRTVDVAGVGFGPANLALAIALEESDAPTTMAFHERQASFGWHTGMLIEGATMQVSFLKDLATMRNPGSRHTFLAYLHAHGRMPAFINSKMLYPYRVEFHDYLGWSAAQFDAHVSYGSTVEGIRPVQGPDGHVDLVEVVTRDADGARQVQRARNVVLGTGMTPHLPPGVTPSARIRHSSQLLTHGLGTPRHGRYLVVGAGQSAAECADYLHRTHGDAAVHTVHARYGYSVADDSPFANGIFDPAAVDDFFHAPEQTKEALLGYHGNTNYAVVDLDLSQELFRRVYLEEVQGRPRLHVHRVSRVRACTETADGVEVEVESLVTGEVTRLVVDGVVYATGYRPADPLPLLGDLADECKKDESGGLYLDRDYRVRTSSVLRCGIYLHGAGTEGSHGLSAGLLSNTAVRAGEIATSIIRQT